MAKRLSKSKTSQMYLGKSTLFKIFLLGGVGLISALFIWYTFNVIDGLKKDTRSQVEKYVHLWTLAANSEMSNTELQFIFDEIIVKATIPIVVLDDDRKPILSRNVPQVAMGDNSDEATAKLKKIADEMVRNNGEFPLIFATKADTFVNYFCYGDSEVINQLKIMPFIEIGIIFAFLLVAFIGFQNIRRSEERHIWVGMAKETAHQLGTPISSLMGWLEVMEAEKNSGSLSETGKKLIEETITNMRLDVVRLKKVANRFGKIGSIPELIACDLNQLTKEAVDYYRRRIPFEGKGVQIIFNPGDIPETKLNQELFGWTLENLIKNSLQSVDPKTGQLNLSTRYKEGDRAIILEISDNGLGIPAAAARKIFSPGFTTKKRGWGLGLTLVKRIIEEYHGGKISLKKSKPGETIFEIQLPV